MKALVLSDIHLRTANLRKLLDKVDRKEIELIIVCGDFSNFGGSIKEILKELDFAPLFAVPGNLDTREIIEELEEKGFSLHGKKKKFGNRVFIGFGGGTLGTPGEVNSSEEEIYATLKGLLKGVKNAVLVTHAPPKGTKIDEIAGGKHIGSESIKRAIEEFQPELHFCGHVHEAAGQELIGKTLSLNVASVKEGKLTVADLKEKKFEVVEVLE